MRKIYIIILHYNGIGDTLECLSSLAEIIVPKDMQAETLVVDNASSDNLKSQISNLKSNSVKLIRNKKNLGFAGGNNIGIKYALSDDVDYILLLNNDTLVNRNFLKELLSVLTSDVSIGIVSPKIYFAKGFEFHKDRYKKDELGRIIWYAGGKIDWQNVIAFHKGVDDIDKGQYNQKSPTEFATGCCMLVKREVFEKIGFFNENYFLYYEDSDFSLRAINAGYQIYFAPNAVIWHKNAGAAGGSGSNLQDYYITRNRMLFGMRHAPIRSKLALIREGLSIILKGRVWQRRGIIDFYLGRFSKGSFRK